MNRPLLVPIFWALCLLLSLKAEAQSSKPSSPQSDRYLSVELQTGVSHYAGDLSAKPEKGIMGMDMGAAGPQLGLGVSRRLSPRFTARGTFLWARIQGDDADRSAADPLRARNLHFRNDILEASARLQYDLLPHRGHFSERRLLVPYLFAGAGIYAHNPKARYSGTWVALQPLGTEGQGRSGYADRYARVGFSVPMGLGANLRLTDRMTLGLEWTLHKTFGDYLDDVSGVYANPADLSGMAADLAMPNIGPKPESGMLRGDAKGRNDHWSTFGFRLGYILNRNPNKRSLSRMHYLNRDVRDIEQTTSLAAGNAFMQFSDRYVVRPLSINTQYDEQMPVYYKSGILYVSDKQGHKSLSKHNRNAYFNFFYSPTNDLFRNEINKPIQLAGEQVATYHHFSGTPLNRGEAMIVEMYERDGMDERVRQHKLFLVEDVSEVKWQEALPMVFNNPDFSVGNPCLNEVGDILYFSSDMPGGLGGTDIYVSYKFKGQWTYPINLGAPVNTPGNEMTPFIHPDGMLYFASDGQGGMGGMDLYEAIPDPSGGFSKVENLGSPINSTADDFGLVLNEIKREGYYTSNRQGGRGGNDIYQLKVDKIAKTRQLTDQKNELFKVTDLVLNGQVRIKDRQTPVERAIITLTNLFEDRRQIVRTDSLGRFSFSIRNEAEYDLNATVPGYKRMDPMRISTIGLSASAILEEDIELEPMSYRMRVRGTVRDKRSKAPIQEAEIALYDLETSSQEHFLTDADGNYSLDLEQDKTYVVMVLAKGYAPEDREVSTQNQKGALTMRLDFGLDQEKDKGSNEPPTPTQPTQSTQDGGDKQ